MCDGLISRQEGAPLCSEGHPRMASAAGQCTEEWVDVDMQHTWQSRGAERGQGKGVQANAYGRGHMHVAEVSVVTEGVGRSSCANKRARMQIGSDGPTVFCKWPRGRSGREAQEP